VGSLSFLQVSGGGGHSCGVTTDNRAYCWGENHYGQLGDGTFGTDRVRPAAVLGGLQFVQVSLSGAHTCGVTTDRRLYCWGFNFFGQLGDGSSLHQHAPVVVAGGRQFRSVEVGQIHTCALSYPTTRPTAGVATPPAS
jgi:alpha-tubulin suppressor-like RCC1 family protein